MLGAGWGFFAEQHDPNSGAAFEVSPPSPEAQASRDMVTRAANIRKPNTRSYHGDFGKSAGGNAAYDSDDNCDGEDLSLEMFAIIA